MRLQRIALAWMSVLRPRHSGLVLAAALLTLAAGPHLAGAVDSPPPPRDPGNRYADDKLVPREMMRQYREMQKRDEQRKSDEAKAERQASRLKYRDRSKHEALDIARAKFERILEAPAWAGLDLQPGEKLKDYVDDFQALIDVGDDPGDTALVESTLPLVNEEDEPTDLALEPQGDGFAPKAAAVELGLPADVAEGVTVAGGQLTVTPVADATTDGIETEDKVFYANAQNDTDVLVVPKARGFETFHQLRSAESPEQLAFDVGVPGGASLRFGDVPGSTPDERGIDVVSPGGKVIARISPPLAIGADGEPVDVDYAIDGTRVTMSVAHRDKDVAYPILVDPDFQMEEFRWQYGNRDTYNWRFGAAGGCSNWTGFFGQGFWTFGHILYAQTNWQACGGDEWAEWNWQAPRMSHIYRAEFYNQNHPFREDCILNALWAPWAGNWDGGWVWLHCGDLWDHSRGHCPVSNDCNPDYGAPSNAAIWKLQNGWWGGWRQYGGWAELGGAVIYVRDRDNPVIDSIGQTTDSRWYKAGSGTAYVRPRAHDDGLGMNKFQLNVPGRADEYRYHPCVRSRCPGSWSLPNDGQSEFSHSVDALPEGINTISLYARDALDKITGTSYTVNVDRSAPWLNVYGALRDAANAPTWTGTKTLWIQSADGNTSSPASQRSGVTSVEILVDGVRKEYRTQSCFASCTLDFNWTLHSDQYPRGSHTVRVIARDGAGHSTSSSTWTVSTDPTEPGGEDRVDSTDTGVEPLAPETVIPNTCAPDPETGASQNCANTGVENQAINEPGITRTDSFGLPKIDPGAAGGWNWGFSDNGGDRWHPSYATHFDDPRFKRLGVKKLRIMIPWDILQRNAGDSTYSFYLKRPDGSVEFAPALVKQTAEEMNEYDRVMTKVAELMNLPSGDPNKLLEVHIAIYTTEASGVYKGTWPDYKDQVFDLKSRVLPDRTTYINNVKAIVNRYRQWPWNLPIKFIEAFNEPNHPAYPPHGEKAYPQYWNAADPRVAFKKGAAKAASYYNVLREWCQTAEGACAPIAGSFIDRKELLALDKPLVNGKPEYSYLYWYKDALAKKSPPIWGYHAYNAAAYSQAKQTMVTDRMVNFHRQTKPSDPNSVIWLTEQGPLYAGTNGNQNAPLCKTMTGDALRNCQWTEGVKQLDWLMNNVVKSVPNNRIKRFYYYSFRGDPQKHDSGLVDPYREANAATYSRPNQLRPTYCTWGARSNPPFTFAADAEVRGC